MGTSVSLTESALVVDPGGSVSTQMRVRNTGEVVDQFVFQPLGDAAMWMTVEPPQVRLFPDTDETVTVTIAPPRESSSTPGVAVWAVKAMPQEDPDGAAVAEGSVDVGTFYELSAELQPTTGRGRLSGRFDVAIDNRGNVPLPVRLSGTDAEQTLGFEFASPIIETAPGEAHFTKLRIKPENRIWRGPSKSHPFELLVESQLLPILTPPMDGTGGDEGRGGAVALAAPPAPPAIQPMTIAGSLVQEPVIPKWWWKAMVLLAVALLALWVLWKTILQPTVESAAREIAIEEVAELEEQVAEVEEQVEEQQAEVAEVAEEVAEVAEDVQAVEDDVDAGAGGGGALDGLFNETTRPDKMRLETSALPGASDSDDGPVLGADESFAITDFVLQNPRGDLGTIKIIVGGETVIEASLGNFRTLDFHYVAPYIVDAANPLRIEMACVADTLPSDGVCDPAVSFSGFRTTLEPAAGG